jgi:pimeloyl-ACP methyl ester carboxylesterase
MGLWHPVGDGFILLSPDGVANDFAQDLSGEEKDLLTATQPQTSGSIFGAEPTQAAWHSKPSWYVVASKDRMIAPEHEASMAAQMEAVTTTLPASHVVMLSHPKEVAQVIVDAANGTR